MHIEINLIKTVFFVFQITPRWLLFSYYSTAKCLCCSLELQIIWIWENINQHRMNYMSQVTVDIWQSRYFLLVWYGWFLFTALSDCDFLDVLSFYGIIKIYIKIQSWGWGRIPSAIQADRKGAFPSLHSMLVYCFPSILSQSINIHQANLVLPRQLGCLGPGDPPIPLRD